MSDELYKISNRIRIFTIQTYWFNNDVCIFDCIQGCHLGRGMRGQLPPLDFCIDNVHLKKNHIFVQYFKG